LGETDRVTYCATTVPQSNPFSLVISRARARPVLELLGLPVGPSLLATRMPGSDKRASGCVAHHASDYGAACCTPSPISRTLGVLLLLRLLLLLLGLRLLRGLRRCRWRPRICGLRLR
jgi:hypothetical protein